MKRLSFIVVMLFSFGSLYSQYNVAGNGTSIDRARNIQTKVKFNNYSAGKIQKSKFNYFLNDDWQGGVMFIDDSTSINGYTYRYNIYTDQIELRSMVNPSEINIISIGTKKFIYSDFYDTDSVINKGYFELIANGECKLLLRREITYTQLSSDVKGYGSSESTSIKEVLFLEKDNLPAIELVKSKEFLLNVLSDKKRVVDYINDRTILFLTEKKVKEIIEYYNNI